MVSLTFYRTTSRPRPMSRCFIQLRAFRICTEFPCPRSKKIQRCGLLCTSPCFESTAVAMRRTAARPALCTTSMSSLESRVSVWRHLAVTFEACWTALVSWRNGERRRPACSVWQIAPMRLVLASLRVLGCSVSSGIGSFVAFLVDGFDLLEVKLRAARRCATAPCRHRG